jgi:hypothetical protein
MELAVSMPGNYQDPGAKPQEKCFLQISTIGKLADGASGQVHADIYCSRFSLEALAWARRLAPATSGARSACARFLVLGSPRPWREASPRPHRSSAHACPSQSSMSQKVLLSQRQYLYER